MTQEIQKEVVAQTGEGQEMPLNDVVVTFVEWDHFDDNRLTRTFKEVEYFNVSNGFFVVQPKGENLIAINADHIYQIETIAK